MKPIDASVILMARLAAAVIVPMVFAVPAAAGVTASKIALQAEAPTAIR
jgi:hypothetical protein